MKRFVSLAVALMVGAAAFTSCNGDVNFKESITKVNSNDSIEIFEFKYASCEYPVILVRYKNNPVKTTLSQIQYQSGHFNHTVYQTSFVLPK